MNKITKFDFNHYFWQLILSESNNTHLKVFWEFIMKSDLIITINEDIKTHIQ
jgi:hypothetical protein